MLNISFDFNENTLQVSNVRVTQNTHTNISKVNSNNYDMEVVENKIILTSNALEKLGVSTGDRVSINYWTINNKNTYPIISKSDVFTDGSDGTKVTKSGTISFRGEQRNILLEYGRVFSFEEFVDNEGLVKPGVFKLVAQKDEVVDNELSDEETALRESDLPNFTDDITAISSDDNEDDLPFI